MNRRDVSEHGLWGTMWGVLLALSVLVWLALHTCGCAGSLGQAPSAPSSERRCVALDNQHRTWGALAKFSGVLAGSGGLVAIPTDEHKDVRWAAGLSAAALGAFAAASIYVAEDAASTWARDCAAKPDVVRSDFAGDCLGVMLSHFAGGSTCAETQLAVDASDRCRTDYPGGVRLECPEFGR